MAMTAMTIRRIFPGSQGNHGSTFFTAHSKPPRIVCQSVVPLSAMPSPPPARPIMAGRVDFAQQG